MKHTTVDDLLMDDTFLAWYHRSDPNAVRMWDAWIAASPDHRRLAKEAMLLLDMLILKEQGPSGLQIQKAVSRMEARISAEKNRRKNTFKHNYPVMLLNWFKISRRQLVKNKAYSFINIGGLAIGMTVTILIGLWIWDELSYNKYHKNYDHIASVWQRYDYRGEAGAFSSMPIPLGDELRNTYKDDLKYVVMSSGTGKNTIGHGDKKFILGGRFMGADAPDMFSLKMLQGTRQGLQEPASILLSARLAGMLFHDADPMGQVVRIDNRVDVKVTGVYEDLPRNTELHDVMFITPWQLYLTRWNWVRDLKDIWGSNSFEIFVQLQPHAAFDKTTEKIKGTMLRKDPKAATFHTSLFLHPMSRWRLYSAFENGVSTGGRIRFVWLFGTVGLFVLLLACINFMNLSTARSEKRAKEVGIRKTIGSLRGQLVGQFFSESILLALIAFLLSLVLVQLMLPWFNGVADKSMSLLWFSPWFWLSGIGFAIFTGFIAGSYPALYLSSFQPIRVLKGTFRAGRFAAIPRKVLVVVQFTVSVLLIICTAFVFRQIQYAKDRPVGYNREGLIAVQMTTPEIYSNYQVIRNNLLSSGTVASVAESQGPVTDVWVGGGGFDWNGKEPGLETSFAIVGVAHDYGKTVGWQFKEGRDFSAQLATDSMGFVLNEAAVKYMGLQNPVGEIIRLHDEPFQVLGVIQDMIMTSPYAPVQPTVYYIMKEPGNFINIKIQPGISASAALKKIAPVFEKYNPAAPFNYQFVDEEYARKFGEEERVGTLSSFFAALAIFISCLGLFGLVAFVAEQRTKEIGIRKVLGATIVNVWQLLSKEFVLLVLLSCCIAIPAAWYFMHHWLQQYEYRTAMSWYIFAAAGMGALIITLLTVSFQAIRAAVANPVKSLRTE